MTDLRPNYTAHPLYVFLVILYYYFGEFFWYTKPPTNFYAASICVHWDFPIIHAQPYARGRASWRFLAKNGDPGALNSLTPLR